MLVGRAGRARGAVGLAGTVIVAGTIMFAGAVIVAGTIMFTGAFSFANAIAFASALTVAGAGWRWAVVVGAGAAGTIVLREGRAGEGGDAEEQEQAEGRGFHGRGRTSWVALVEPELPGRRARAGCRRRGPAGHGGVAFGWQSCSGITVTVQRGSVNCVFGKAGELLRGC